MKNTDKWTEALSKLLDTRFNQLDGVLNDNNQSINDETVPGRPELRVTANRKRAGYRGPKSSGFPGEK